MCHLLLYIVLLFIRAPFYVLLIFVAIMFCLLVVLVKLSVIARKTPLRKPNRGEGSSHKAQAEECL